jgi:phosphatidate phosphatase APP1
MSWRDDISKLAGEFIGDAQRLGTWALAGGGPALYDIAAYRGYGTSSRVLVQGRVIRSKDIGPAGEHDSLLINLVNTYKRIDSDPVAGARVRVTVGMVERELTADNEGYFREWIDLASPLTGASPWENAQYQLVSPLLAVQPDVRGVGRIRIPREGTTFGVISDLDDTVIQSRVSNFLQAVRTIMLGNARTRLPFPGVAGFYRALERGGDGLRQNPIFYVSSSPWNIYDVIHEFLTLQEIPDGPILLRDWDVALSSLASSHLRAHKEPLIEEILALYPSLPFILIGDTSQHDPEIYREVVRRHPSRILAIYIRDVTLNPARAAAVNALAEEVRAAGSSLVLSDDTDAAKAHAAANGWILRAEPA